MHGLIGAGDCGGVPASPACAHPSPALPLPCRYDRNKLTLKDIHNCQYVACMNPTAGSFTIDSRLQVGCVEPGQGLGCPPASWLCRVPLFPLL